MNDYNLKPFDKVLVRDEEIEQWSITLFEQYKKDAIRPYLTIGPSYKHCIPYEGNEHLLGTTDEPQPKRWRAEKGEKYWYVCSYGSVDYVADTRTSTDDCRYAIGNYFMTRYVAEEMAVKFKEMLKEGNNEND